MSRSKDWLSLVEAAYRIDLSGPDLSEHLAQTTLPLLGAGLGAFAFSYTFDMVTGAVALGDISFVGVPRDQAASLTAGIRESAPDGILPFLRATQPHGAVSSNPELAPVMPFLERALGHLPVRDSVGLVARVSWGQGLVVGTHLPKRRRVGRDGRNRLGRIAAHLEAGMRLRLGFARRQPSLDTPDVEAVMDPDGKLLHAAGDGASPSARALLRETARSIDRARGALRRRDPDASLALWRGMVDGRWSLVDHFDHDGRRFVVARKNPTGLEDPRALTERESQVAHLVSLGKTNAETAYALGLSEATVRNQLSAALRKLGLARRRELVRLAQGALRATEFDSDAGRLRVSSTARPAFAARADVTAAERDVLTLVVQGLGDREIAAHRGVSARTVAKQVGALLRKHEVSTREELLRRVLDG